VGLILLLIASQDVGSCEGLAPRLRMLKVWFDFR
jgi:hypothetical protein